MTHVAKGVPTALERGGGMGKMSGGREVGRVAT